MGSVWNYPHVPIGSVVFGGARFAEFRTILFVAPRGAVFVVSLSPF